MNSSLSMLSQYAGYFHDGSIHDIMHYKDSLVISIESAQLLPEWYWDRKKLPLSKRDTISGKLYFVHVNSLKQDDKPSHEAFKMVYEGCEVFDIKIEVHKIKMLVTWEQYLPKRERTDMVCIEIEADKIYWENIPNLFDDYWDSLG